MFRHVLSLYGVLFAARLSSVFIGVQAQGQLTSTIDETIRCINKPDGIYPDTSDCRRYYHCVREKIFYFRCFDTFYFDTCRFRCDRLPKCIVDNCAFDNATETTTTPTSDDQRVIDVSQFSHKNLFSAKVLVLTNATDQFNDTANATSTTDQTESINGTSSTSEITTVSDDGTTSEIANVTGELSTSTASSTEMGRTYIVRVIFNRHFGAIDSGLDNSSLPATTTPTTVNSSGSTDSSDNVSGPFADGTLSANSSESTTTTNETVTTQLYDELLNSTIDQINGTDAENCTADSLTNGCNLTESITNTSLIDSANGTEWDNFNLTTSPESINQTGGNITIDESLLSVENASSNATLLEPTTLENDTFVETSNSSTDSNSTFADVGQLDLSTLASVSQTETVEGVENSTALTTEWQTNSTVESGETSTETSAEAATSQSGEKAELLLSKKTGKEDSPSNLRLISGQMLQSNQSGPSSASEPPVIDGESNLRINDSCNCDGNGNSLPDGGKTDANTGNINQTGQSEDMAKSLAETTMLSPEQCHSLVCDNGGFYVELSSGHCGCVCQIGWRGERCQMSVDDAVCGCQNGGQCIKSRNGAAVCLCPPGYIGDRCQYEYSQWQNFSQLEQLLPCRERKVCQNGGVCLRRLNTDQDTCFCIDGHKGDLCQDPI